MTDQTPSSEDRLTQVEQIVSEHSRSFDQVYELLLLTGRRFQEIEGILRESSLQQQANAQQIAANAEAIADLRAILRDQYGNGHTPQ